MTASGRSIAVHDLGLTAYGDALALQRRLQAERRAGQGEDVLLLTQHHPVITLGRGHPNPDLRADPAAIQACGIEIVPTERGGDITYHGPGQLVAYGIINLKGWDCAVLDYVRGLEATAIAVLAQWGLTGCRREGARGVWVGERKIASIGLNVRGWVTMHGLAFNAGRELAGFDLINPCGIPGMEMTSLGLELGRDVPSAEVNAAFAGQFEFVFGCTAVAGSPGLIAG